MVVFDGRGRMLSAWGDEEAERRGKEQNLGPLYSWAEASTGTTRRGSLRSVGADCRPALRALVRGFPDFRSCAAVAVGTTDGRPVGVWISVVAGRCLSVRRLAHRCGVGYRAATRRRAAVTSESAE